MLSGLRGSFFGAMGVGLLGLLLIGFFSGGVAPAADPPAGPELAPPNPELTPPELPPVGAAAAQPGEVQGEALTRGAVHEAFAEPFDVNPKATTIVPRKPPEAINELAPEVKPEGDNVEWIPGYWGWDDERQDFVWVSGLWRKIPPGRRWVPGYWVDADGGFRWVSGMWAEDRVQELNYLPDPPESLEQGPNIAAPSDDYFWIPGCWVYGGAGYRWRAGYWSLGYDNWMWCPARYVWTPRGCFFVPGYWDYAFARRGVLFSPVFFRAGIYHRPAFAFSPSVTLSIGGLSSHLFVGVGFGHYYFGDYYGDACFRRGYHPWHVYHRHRFDPCLNYYAWHHKRHDRHDFVRRLEDRHDHFVKHVDQRPPRTYLAQRDWERRVGDARVGDVRVRDTGDIGRSLRDVQNRRDNDNNVRLVRVADTQRREIEQHRTQLRELTSERSKLERVAGDGRVRDVNGRPGDRGPIVGGRGPGSGDASRRGPSGVADATRGDTARLKLPQTIGAEQRAATTRRTDGPPGVTRTSEGRRDGVDRVPGGRVDGSGRGDSGGRGNIGQPSAQPRDGQPGDSQSRVVQPRDVQSRDGQPRTAQPREGLPRESQPRILQPRDDQPRTVAPRESQPRETQPRQIQPRESQPRSFQPRESQPRESQPREFQPRGGNSGSRDSQPRGGQPRGSGRDRSGRTSVDEAPLIVTEKQPAPSIVKPREPAVMPKQNPPVVRQESKPAVRSRESVETRLKPSGEASSRGDSSRRSVESIAPRSSQPRSQSSDSSGRSSRGSSDAGAAPRSRSSESSSRSSSGGRSEIRSDSGRSSGESRNSRSGESDSKSSKDKESDRSSRSGGRGR